MWLINFSVLVKTNYYKYAFQVTGNYPVAQFKFYSKEFKRRRICNLTKPFKNLNNNRKQPSRKHFPKNFFGKGK